ncbi:hypothetical protein BH23DEI1_BH23DEI1_11790 [soil metagenome]
MPIRDELVARTIERLRSALERLAVGEWPHGPTPGSHGPDADERLHDLREIRREVERLYGTYVGSGSALVHRLGSEDLLGVLRSAGTVDGERAYLLAALIEVDAAAIERDPHGADPELAEALRIRALDLVLEAGLADVGETDVDDRVERLSARVPPYRRAEATWARLHAFAVARGAYARAEDTLFAWLAHAPDGSVAPAGRAYYAHLLTLSDEALEVGNLPRSEVEEGRGAFEEALTEAGVASAS